MKRTGGREWYTRTRVPCDARRPSIRRVVVETRCKDHKTRMFISAVHRRYAGWWCAHGAHVAEMYVAYNIASCRCNRLPPRQPFHDYASISRRERFPTARGTLLLCLPNLFGGERWIPILISLPASRGILRRGELKGMPIVS